VRSNLHLRREGNQSIVIVSVDRRGYAFTMDSEIHQNALATIADTANRLVWKNPDFNLLHLRPVDEYPLIARVLHDQLIKAHGRGRLMLPDLAAFDNSSVAVFSDYAGESSGNYYTYSALVCGWNYIGAFAARMAEVRKLHSLGEKEISFKDFGMGQLRRSLPDYLTALNNLLPGFLCTLIVDKRIETLFGPDGRQLAEMLETEGVGEWKPKLTEKLLRVAHLTAFLTVLLARDGQKVFWMTDNDSVCANDEQHMGALKVFERAIRIYQRPNQKFALVGGARPFNPKSLDTLDILSACDVTASTLEHYFTRKNRESAEELVVKAGAETVLSWLTSDGIGLKKATFIVKYREDSQIDVGTVDFTPVEKPTNLTLIPIFM
jgi:hypothetical protein